MQEHGNVAVTFCIMLAVFEVGYITCTASPNSVALIVGRAIPGVGAAGLVTGPVTILLYCVALQTQVVALPIILGLYGIGSAMGPLIR
jgi:MFS family permease